jgi:hypothetical protein
VLAIRPLLYVPTRFGALSVITDFGFVWAVAPNGAVIGHTIGEAPLLKVFPGYEEILSRHFYHLTLLHASGPWHQKECK